MLCYRSRICALLVSVAVASSCATRGRVQRDDAVPMTASAPVPVQRSRDMLSSKQIAARGVRTAYDAIVQLRPEFLKPASPPLTAAALRTRQGADELLEEPDGRFPTVFLNGVRQGGPAVLRTIPSTTIFDIRYFSAPHIPTKYGLENRDGVIDVRTTP